MPKVSVIIPIYGVEKYISRCAISLFEQTLNDIEYIFIDDCTPDHSVDILKDIINKYQDRLKSDHKIVKIVKMPINSGLATVRMQGVKLAVGDFIIHCDSDDWVDHDAYRLMYEAAIKDDADTVLCNYALHDGINVVQEKKGCISTQKEEYINELFYQRSEWPLWNRMIRRELCQRVRYHAVCNMGEDMVLSIQYTVLSNKITIVPKVLYYYFANPNSIVRTVTLDSVINKYKQLNENVKVLIKAVHDIAAGGLKYDKELKWLYYRCANTLLPYIKNVEAQRLWYSHFRGKNIEFLKHSRVNILRKFRHVLIFEYITFKSLFNKNLLEV